MTLGDVISISGHRTFTLEEANEIIPLIDNMSAKVNVEVEQVLKVQRYCVQSGASKERIKDLDNEIHLLLTGWSARIFRLGGRPFQAGYVGFDNGFGYYVWRSPEETIQYFCQYTQPPWDRVKLETVNQKT